MKKHLEIRISGLVQGVFFRAATKEKADALLLTGLVRNEPDGTVYAEVEGEEEDLKLFVQWCHQGPPHAEVHKCDVQEGTVRNYTKFVIER